MIAYLSCDSYVCVICSLFAISLEDIRESCCVQHPQIAWIVPNNMATFWIYTVISFGTFAIIVGVGYCCFLSKQKQRNANRVTYITTGQPGMLVSIIVVYMLKQSDLAIHLSAAVNAYPYAAPVTTSNNIYSTPNYTHTASPYAAPSTSSGNVYSTPYGQTQQFNSQYASPPAYSNSAFTNQDSSNVDRKF